MGMHTWLSEQEFKRYSRIQSDMDLDEALQEVRSVMPEWYVDERIEKRKSFWGRVTLDTHYTVYQRQGISDEVRIQISATRKEGVANLLYGLYMGYHKAKLDEKG